MTNMNTKREYTHEDMEELGVVINELKLIARQVDQDVASGRITHEQWVVAAHELMERKKEILEILADVDRYKMDLRKEIQKEKDLLQKAEERIAILEAKSKNGKSNVTI